MVVLHIFREKFKITSFRTLLFGMRIVLPEKITKDLWENSSDIETNGFFYDKIFDERDFWLEKWKLNIEKLKLYKDVLKREYFELLQEVKAYDKYFKTEKFKKFLGIKNELKYILDVLFNLWYVEAFYFWYDFKSNEWDENDDFWWKITKEEKELALDDKKMEDIKKILQVKKLKEKLENKVRTLDEKLQFFKLVEKLRWVKLDIRKYSYEEIPKLIKQFRSKKEEKIQLQQQIEELNSMGILEFILFGKKEKQDFEELVIKRIGWLYILNEEVNDTNLKGINTFLKLFEKTIWIKRCRPEIKIWAKIKDKVESWLEDEGIWSLFLKSGVCS